MLAATRQEQVDVNASSTSATPTRSVVAGADTAWLSWLRVVAICAVVGIHTVGFNAIRPHTRDTLRGQLALLLDLGATFAVPVFVMASGAMLLDPARFRGNAAFLRKRAARLVPPLVFWHAWYLGLIVVVIGGELSVRAATDRILDGNLYTALYFFWIVFGLALVAPVLVPFVRDNGRRGALVAGSAFAAIPVVTMATLELRSAPLAFSDWALTWWFPYLGMFLLGYALRGVVLRGAPLAAVVVAALALGVLQAWQWHNPDAPHWLQTLTPVSYYSLTGLLQAVAVYLAFQGLVTPAGPLRMLTSANGVRLGRLLGDATLGVYALHLTVLYVVQRLGIGGPRKWSPTGEDMLLRLLVVLVVTWAIVLVLRRVPYVRALL
jgi:surface polysaccharide O-acyltransferase-like enzyme